MEKRGLFTRQRVLLFWGGGIVLFFLLEPTIDRWQSKRLAEQREAEKAAVNVEASLAGMLFVGAWRDCLRIGINDVQACASYEGKLLQEIAAPKMAQQALKQSQSFYANCTRFHAYEYCYALLRRSIQLSAAIPES